MLSGTLCLSFVMAFLLTTIWLKWRRPALSSVCVKSVAVKPIYAEPDDWVDLPPVFLVPRFNPDEFRLQQMERESHSRAIQWFWEEGWIKREHFEKWLLDDTGEYRPPMQDPRDDHLFEIFL